MSDSLEDTWLKLARAKKHLNELQRKVDAFVNRKPYTLFRHDDPEHGRYIYRGKIVRMPPETWGPIIGDAVHNMRSAIDCLAWALCTKPSRVTAFPIFTSPPKEERSKRRFDDMIRHIPPDAQEIIKELQPYNYGDLAKLYPLAVLQWLSNTDKHQVLVAVGTLINAPTKVIPGSFISNLSFNEREVEFEVSVKIGDEMHFEKALSFHVMIQGIPSLELPGLDYFRLRDIHQFIREDVIPRFAGFFLPP